MLALPDGREPLTERCDLTLEEAYAVAVVCRFYDAPLSIVVGSSRRRCSGSRVCSTNRIPESSQISPNMRSTACPSPPSKVMGSVQNRTV